MSVIGLIVILCVLGLIGWLVNTKLPGVPTIKLIINIVLIIIAVLLCLSAFGVLDEVRSMRVPKI